MVGAGATVVHDLTERVSMLVARPAGSSKVTGQDLGCLCLMSSSLPRRG
jgi:hypothetical protein